jgi:hypothetical protein
MDEGPWGYMMSVYASLQDLDSALTSQLLQVYLAGTSTHL